MYTWISQREQHMTKYSVRTLFANYETAEETNRDRSKPQFVIPKQARSASHIVKHPWNA